METLYGRSCRSRGYVGVLVSKLIISAVLHSQFRQRKVLELVATVGHACAQ